MKLNMSYTVFNFLFIVYSRNVGITKNSDVLRQQSHAGIKNNFGAEEVRGSAVSVERWIS